MWVAIRGFPVTSNHLFSNKKSSPECETVETELLKRASPLTCGQRCADWFALKLLLSVTMAGKVYSKAKSLDNNDKISDEQLQDILEQCHKFWFDRHTSGGAMAEGTSNEMPTVEKFAAYQFVLQFFEVGLLQSKEADFIARIRLS